MPVKGHDDGNNLHDVYTTNEVLSILQQTIDNGSLQGIDPSINPVVESVREAHSNNNLTFWQGTEAEFNALGVSGEILGAKIDSNGKIYVLTGDTTLSDAVANAAAAAQQVLDDKADTSTVNALVSAVNGKLDSSVFSDHVSSEVTAINGKLDTSVFNTHVSSAETAINGVVLYENTSGTGSMGTVTLNDYLVRYNYVDVFVGVAGSSSNKFYNVVRWYYDVTRSEIILGHYSHSVLSDSMAQIRYAKLRYTFSGNTLTYRDNVQLHSTVNTGSSSSIYANVNDPSAAAIYKVIGYKKIQ